MLTIIGLFLVSLGVFLYVLFGNPYPRISLMGTEYIENSVELHYLSQQNDEPYYLIKKYKYSRNVWMIGYGGGVGQTDDYYGLGIADKDKKEILPPIYEFLYAEPDTESEETIIHCAPYRKTGYEPDENFKIVNNKAIPIYKSLYNKSGNNDEFH